MNLLNLKEELIVDNHPGELIMVLGKVDAVPNCDEYIKKLEEKLHQEKRSFCSIGVRPMIEDKTIRDNIIFGEKYEEQKYQEVIEVVGLKKKINEFPEGD